MDDVISLDAMEAKKRLNKKPIKQCIMESYCYVMALSDRIESGDLYGGLVELTPEQMKESFGIEMQTTPPEGSGLDDAGLGSEPAPSAAKSSPVTGSSSENAKDEIDEFEDLDDDDLSSGNPI